MPIPSILADPSESQDCSGREQCMDAHTAASVPGALPSSYISALEARYFLPSSVSWRLLGHLHTSEDTSEYSHWKRQKSYLKKKLKDLTEVLVK